MSRILTHSEFESLPATTFHKTGEPEATTPRPAPRPHHNEGNEKAIRTEYLFIHPDKLHDRSDGKFCVMRNNGHAVEIPIQCGCLKTDDEEIKNVLISKGMIFTHEREINEN